MVYKRFGLYVSVKGTSAKIATKQPRASMFKIVENFVSLEFEVVKSILYLKANVCGKVCASCCK